MSKPWVTGRDVAFPEFRVSNGLLGNRAALDETFARDGYWFFRDVLDHGAIAQVRDAFVDELVELGVVDAGDPEIRYNGNSRAGLPETPVSGILEGLFRRAPWKAFVQNTSVRRVVREILGDEPYWIPVLGYRVAQPGCDPAEDRFVKVHQDGFYNRGIPFLNCWVPLVEMDSEVGGLAVAEGMHAGPCVHDLEQPPRYPAMQEAVPRTTWRTTHFCPGDLLVLHLDAPHTGISNISRDRFRLSLDMRMLPASGPLPAIGSVVAISPEEIVVRSEDGTITKLAVRDETYCRGRVLVGGDRIDRTELPANYDPGDAVIVAYEGHYATVIRPAKY